MKNFAILCVGAALLAGCLSSAPEKPKAWTIDADVDFAVSSIYVVSPYDGARFVVMRPDGSVAFDEFNAFSARPSALLRGVFRTDFDAQALVVRKLALDCTKEGERKALVELGLGDLKEASAIRATASADTDDGNYSKAFGAAFVRAVEELKRKQAQR